MAKSITEAQTLTVHESTTPGRISLQLIDAGWGSSGYYSPKVLENAASDQVFPAGTHIFFDHPSESERHDRPERSVRDLAAVLDEDATYKDGALVAEAKVIGPYRELITDPVFIEAVGMSIRASADTTIGEADGRKGTIVTQLIEGASVDLVTRAGRGGRILAAVESARRDLNEATAGDTREALYAAVKATHGGEDTYAWVRDYDPDEHLVYFETEDADGMRTYQQPYEMAADGTASLTGDPVEVRVTTSYVPVSAVSATPDVPAPAGQSTATTESQETNMATTQIEETVLASLRSDAERVPTLESERDALQRERDEAREAIAVRDRTAHARRVIEAQASEHGTEFSPLEERGLLTDLPVTEGGDLDETSYTATVTEAATTKAATTSARNPFGFGATVTEAANYGVDEFDAAFARKEG